MLIPLGILASSGGGAAGSFDLISTTILGSATSSVTFDVTGLGSTYKHLQIRMTTRNSVAGTGDDYAFIRFNSDTGSNYAFHRLYGYSGSVYSTAGTSITAARMGITPRNGETSGLFNPVVVDILDPFSSSKNKTLRSLSGGTGVTMNMMSGLWMNTTAVTSVSIVEGGGGNFVTGSRFSIYGIKG
jgi:hypothetical protein